MARPHSVLLSLVNLALPLALLLAASAISAQANSRLRSADSPSSGVEKFEGIWKVEPLSLAVPGIDFVRFGAANSAQWFHFVDKDSCWTSRHQYRLVRDRMIFTPPLSDGRSWWQPNFETPARIDLLQRTRTEQGRSSQRVRLVRAALPQANCEVRESQ